MKTKSLKRDLKNTKLVVVIFCVSIAIVGSILLSLSFAALPEVNAGVARPGVPIPTQGAYFGGINKENIPSTYQIQTTPGCTDTSDQWKILECKIAWAGRQQGLAVPTDYAANMEHFFTSCDTGNSTFTSGEIYKSSQVKGRKLLFLNMKCSSWPVLASGTGTEYQSAEAKIREKIRLMAKLAVPVMFVYNHEPENDGGKADDYRAAFRRVSAIVRSEQEAINNNTISIGWAPMGCSFEGLNTDGSLSGVTRDCPTYFPEHWYPGDDAVDWVMAQPYNKYGCTNKSDISKCNTFDDLVDDFYNWANAPCPKINIPTGNYNCTTARQKKPLALGEYGIGSNYDEVIVSKRVEFYERHRVVASTKYPRIKMWAYWSSQVSDRPFRYVVDWPVDANRTNLKGFAKLALDPYFVSPKFSTNQNESPSVSISAPSNGAQYTAPASFTISANASDPENAISKVEFYEGATKLGEDTQAPYSFAVSAKGQGTFSYKAKVIDAAGLSGESSAVTVTINPDTGSGSEISILTPTSNQTVTGTITVQAGPSDGIQEVSFRVNGVWQISDSEAPFAWSWDTTKTTNGPVVLSIRSRKVGDPGSVYTEKSINVNVQNTTTQKRCDFNGDSQVALIDLSLLLSNYGKQVASNTNGDCNGDGSVTLLDLSQLLANYGK